MAAVVSITVTVGGKRRIRLTADEAREMKSILDTMFPEVPGA